MSKLIVITVEFDEDDLSSCITKTFTTREAAEEYLSTCNEFDTLSIQEITPDYQFK